eukprot:9572942-Alexandrium_andersonii.AAC.1
MFRAGDGGGCARPCVRHVSRCALFCIWQVRRPRCSSNRLGSLRAKGGTSMRRQRLRPQGPGALRRRPRTGGLRMGRASAGHIGGKPRGRWSRSTVASPARGKQRTRSIW